MLAKQEKRSKRHKRVRAKIYGTKSWPRLCIFRSSKHIYTQLIDDNNQKILTAASDLELKSKKIPSKITTRAQDKKAKKTKEKEEKGKVKKVAIAYEVGKLIAKKALEKKIEKVVFDRGGYKYHGRIKAVAEGARSEGLKF